MEKTKRLAEIMLQKHPEAFNTDYQKNKEALAELAVIPSKQLRNQIAGYITKALRKDVPEEKEIVEEAKAE